MNGETISEQAKSAGVPLSTALSRRKAGKPIDQPQKRGAPPVENSLEKRAAKIGLTRHGIYRRCRTHGISVEEALAMGPDKRRKDSRN